MERVGGIVGTNASDDGGGTIENCTNEGKVTGTGEIMTLIGGIVGFNGNSSVIKGSTNKGEISGPDRIGGIAGYNGSAAGGGTVVNCTNEGKVAGSKEEITNVGGIVGFNGNSSVTKESTNKGEISGPDRIGGIVGNNGDVIGGGTIEDCTNEGKVIGEPSARTCCAGGIVGFNGNISVTKGSINKGEINGPMNVGGIAGYNGSAEGGAIVENCINEGKVIGKFGGVGGIVGLSTGISGVTGEIKQCYNTGYAVATQTANYSYVGGIVGANNYTTIRDCFNIGKVETNVTGTTTATGGIVGYVYAASTSISNCYNIGEVTGTGATTNYVGGAFGYVNAGAPISSCYFYKKVSTNNVSVTGNSGIVGVAELTRAQAIMGSSYSGWDFTNIWQIDGSSMPHLRGLTKPNVGI